MIATLRELMRKRVKGQSLVETAIFMPVLIILLAGVVEVSNLLVTQNRVSTAARAGTGYGASTFSGDEWDDASTWPSAMATTAINNVTETLDLDPERWDIWAIHAQVNDAGDAFSEWSAVHGYGNNTVIAALEPTIQSDILSELQATADSAPIKGLEIAATVAYHDRSSILGLNAFNFGPLTRVRGLTVMRVDEEAPYTGCPILPISVRWDQYSAYPSNWPPTLQYVRDPADPSKPKYPGDPVNLFPSGNIANGGFEYPNPAPIYLNDATAPNLSTSTFTENTPGIPLKAMAKDEFGEYRGTIFVAREQGPGGGFGWLSWDGSPSATALRDSLDSPGNFIEKYPDSDADLGTTGDPPDAETGDGDDVLEFGTADTKDGYEWLENATGNVHSAEGKIQEHIDDRIPAVLVVYDRTNDLNGENANYRVIGLVQVYILGYSFQGTNAEKWIMFEFVQWGGACK